MAALSNLVDETRFFPALGGLLECLKAELAAAGGPELCFIGITPSGNPPLGTMQCGKRSGVAWISPVSVFPSSAFPTPDEGGDPMVRAPLAMEVMVGVARPYPAPKDRNERADAQDYFDATRLYLSDMAAMRRAIECCFTQAPGGPLPLDHAIGQWTPMEPEFRASGGTWSFWVQ